MQERILDGLKVENEDYIFEGDLIINGPVIVENANLIVAGSIIASEDIIVSGGDISCHDLECMRGYVLIDDGDIFVADVFSAGDVISDCEIYVGYLFEARNISCMNLMVAGLVRISSITATQDVYVMDDCSCYSMNARDVLICGDLIVEETLKYKNFFCEGSTLLQGTSISIG